MRTLLPSSFIRLLPSHQSSPLGLRPVQAPGSVAMSSSPSSYPSFLSNENMYRVLNDIVPLDDCEVYSWFPEPEYNPQLFLEDGDMSDDGFVLDDTVEEEETLTSPPASQEMDVDADVPEWGSQGMDLDDVPPSTSMQRARTGSGSKQKSFDRGPRPTTSDPARRSRDVTYEPSGQHGGGLLWSKMYFFYSR